MVLIQAPLHPLRHSTRSASPPASPLHPLRLSTRSASPPPSPLHPLRLSTRFASPPASPPPPLRLSTRFASPPAPPLHPLRLSTRFASPPASPLHPLRLSTRFASPSRPSTSRLRVCPAPRFMPPLPRAGEGWGEGRFCRGNTQAWVALRAPSSRRARDQPRNPIGKNSFNFNYLPVCRSAQFMVYSTHTRVKGRPDRASEPR